MESIEWTISVILERIKGIENHLGIVWTDPKRKIVVHSTGGLIDQVDNLPPNWIIEFRDYDTGSYPEDRIVEDERGTRYYSYSWENPDVYHRKAYPEGWKDL